MRELYPIPIRLDDISIAGPVSLDFSNISVILMYEVINDSTQRQKHKLINSLVINMPWKIKTGNATEWRCTAINKVISFCATVKQYGDLFTVRKQLHCHPDGTVTSFTDFNTMLTENTFRPDTEILDCFLRLISKSQVVQYQS